MPPVSALKIPHSESNSPDIFSLGYWAGVQVLRPCDGWPDWSLFPWGKTAVSALCSGSRVRFAYKTKKPARYNHANRTAITQFTLQALRWNNEQITGQHHFGQDARLAAKGWDFIEDKFVIVGVIGVAHQMILWHPLFKDEHFKLILLRDKFFSTGVSSF